MKYFASIRFLLLAMLISLALEFVALALFDGAVLMASSFVILLTTIGVFTLWLGMRSTRSHKRLLNTIDKRLSAAETSSSQVQSRVSTLSSIIDLNTQSIRDFHQSSRSEEPHPRELRAIDDIREILQKLELLEHRIR